MFGENVVPREHVVGATMRMIPIRPDLYISIFNYPHGYVYVNFEDRAVAGDAAGNIMFSPSGKFTNIPPTGLSQISFIANITTKIVIVQSERPINLDFAPPDNNKITDTFTATAGSDAVIVAYAYATFVAKLGKRIKQIELECSLFSAYVTVDGTTPSRTGPVGRLLNPGDVYCVPVDGYSDIKFTNVSAGSNAKIDGSVVGD